MEQDIYTLLEDDNTEVEATMEEFELAEAEWELQKIASIWKDAPFIRDFVSTNYGI